MSERFADSDAWLLLSLIYAKEPATRTRIVEIGDFINHAVFTGEELEGGLSRLMKAGLISEHGNRFTPVRKVLTWFESYSPKRSLVHKDLERTRDYLDGLESKSD